MNAQQPNNFINTTRVNLKLISILLCVFIAGGIVLGIFAVNTRTAFYLSERQGHLRQIVTEIKYEWLRFNLSLERVITGDTTLSREKAWTHLDLAKKYTHAALFGGETKKGPVQRTELPQLREHLKKTSALLDRLSQLSTTRLTKSKGNLSSPAQDAVFDDINDKLLEHLEYTEQVLGKIIVVKKGNVSLFAILVGALVFFSSVVLIVLFYRYERQRTRTIQHEIESEDNHLRYEAILKSLATSASSLDFESFMSDFLQQLLEIYDCPHVLIGKLSEDKSKITTLAVHLNGSTAPNFTYSLAETPCQDVLKTKGKLIKNNVQTLYRGGPFLAELNIDSYFGTRLMALDGTIIGIVAVMDVRPLELDQWKEPLLDVFATRMSVELERDSASRELQRHREHLEELLQKRSAEMKTAQDESNKAKQAKSEFLSRMSHELRTPMNAILGFGQILKLDAELLNDTQLSNLNEIIDAGQNLLTLINEVLDLDKIESGELDVVMKKVVLSNVIQQSLAQIQPLSALHNIEIHDQVSTKDHIVFADATHLKQVLVKLLSNAVKYNNIRGRITLSCRVVNRQLQFSITDTGIGINPENIKKLFTPFERLNSAINVEGAGIGLAITKHLVELMRGKIGVSSVPGKGSTFWLLLELQKPATKAAVTDPSSIVQNESIHEY